ncbi:ribosome recycling factor domain-containing protein [Dimargaris cristalligena]|uniref:Ribosome recycling factor domain-containing protein n=1 Tax=Dimargaris cristalligena TaxID=215637 RepID=A0A4P9ZRA9_9FUNG|nr:ribosome recycling factor domain-containing protein [Dimargaris cristalligena]|eukprot:RKP34970.1 ribosome recycling factor domain-containing protein [Dimargaris cristalligena]
MLIPRLVNRTVLARPLIRGCPSLPLLYASRAAPLTWQDAPSVRLYSGKRSAKGKRDRSDASPAEAELDEGHRSRGKNEPIDAGALLLDMEKTKSRMEKTVEYLKTEFKTMRLGQASPVLLDSVKVVYQGDTVNLSDIASVSVKDPQTLLVIPSDEEYKKAIEKAIREAQLGLNPISQDTIIKVPIPKPTKEHRDRLLKNAAKAAEKIKNQIRSIRQDTMKDLKKDSRNSKMSSDELRMYEKQVQELTGRYMKNAEGLLLAKTNEVNRH